MADISVSADQVSIVDPAQAEIHDQIAAESVTRGAALSITSAGKAGLADANAAGKQQFRGISLGKGGAGQGVSLLKRGKVAGFDLAGLAYDAPVYLSDTAGRLADTAGTLSVMVGRVVALTDSDRTKVLYIEADWLRTWV